MSEAQKIGRPMLSRTTKLLPKTRFDVLLWNANYDYLCHAARAEGLTMAAKLNQILKAMRDASVTA